MKNLTTIIRRADIHDHVMALWKTPMFRDSHRKGEFVHKIVDQFSYMPRIFADMSNDTYERAHFSTWWGVMMNREDYTNPYIHDLYWLHEFYHAGHMPYIPGIGRAAFDEKMQRNELEASVLSEILVYFEMPGLREESFPYPIYADRFLKDHAVTGLWKANKQLAIETIRTIRRDVMLSKPEHLMDTTELWIRRFSEQNAVYAITWSDRYGEVEQRMSTFQNMAASSDAMRETAVLHQVEWIETEAAKDAVDNIPFRKEAELFSAFYWSNKEKYTAAMAAK